MSALSSALKLTCRYHRWLRLICLVFLITASICDSQRTRRERPAGDNDVARQSLSYSDKDVDIHDDDEQISVNGDFERNITAEKGKYLGSPCDFVCNPELQHVFCDAITGLCECEKFYPVRLGPTKGCAKPKRLGEQCFYRATCIFADQHSTCTQIQHNAVCDCEEGYHRVSLSRPNKKVFCAEDLVLITTDLPTLLFIASGIAIFTGMICFVLKLFSRARYSRPRHYANANHSSMLFSSDTGIPLTLHGRPSSRSSQRSGSAGPLGCAFTRRPSSGGSRGPLVPASRAGSRRPSLASVHSTGSSSRSYSARRLEKERNEKEQRHALQELRLAKQREQTPQQQQQVVPTPSPRTPHSTDELLPSVEEGKEVFYNEQVPTISGASDAMAMAVTATATVTTAITTSTAITTRISEISPKATPIKPVFDTSAAPRTSDDIFQV